MLFPPLFLLAIATASAAVPPETKVDFTIRNHCPSPIRVFINGKSQGTLPRESSLNRKLDAAWSGLIYSSANGGNANGVGTTRAGFYGETGYYYIVKQQDSFNTGVSITPKVAKNGAFCEKITCNGPSCADAFTAPPTSFVAFSKGVTFPLHSCPNNKKGYTVTFCPSGHYPEIPLTPAYSLVKIHPNANKNKCLDVRGAVLKNGTPVQIYDCNGTKAQRWFVRRGIVDAIQLAGTNFCLDAGSHPANGVGMKIWTCYKDLPAQSWRFTEDNRILLANSIYALDLTDGVLKNANQVQTWKFYKDNGNQIWTTTSGAAN